MAEMTESERQAQFQHDINIINRQADAKIAKLKNDFIKTQERHTVAVKKKVDEIIKKHNARVNKLEMDFNNKKEASELQRDQEQNAVYEADMKELDQIEANLDIAINNVENWRTKESADEVHQLQTHTQRPRKD